MCFLTQPMTHPEPATPQRALLHAPPTPVAHAATLACSQQGPVAQPMSRTSGMRLPYASLHAPPTPAVPDP